MAKKSLLILDGPGLANFDNGDHTGSGVSLDQIRNECGTLAEKLGVLLEFRQSDDQDEIVDWISNDAEGFDALIINPVSSLESGTVDFYRYRSAFKRIAHLNKPIVEVRLDNIFRDGDEHGTPLQEVEGDISFVSGLGKHGYLFSVNAVAKRLGIVVS